MPQFLDILEIANIAALPAAGVAGRLVEMGGTLYFDNGVTWGALGTSAPVNFDEGITYMITVKNLWLG